MNNGDQFQYSELWKNHPDMLCEKVASFFPSVRLSPQNAYVFVQGNLKSHDFQIGSGKNAYDQQPLCGLRDGALFLPWLEFQGGYSRDALYEMAVL